MSDHDTEAINPELPPVESGLRWPEFVALLATACGANFGAVQLASVPSMINRSSNLRFVDLAPELVADQPFKRRLLRPAFDSTAAGTPTSRKAA